MSISYSKETLNSDYRACPLTQPPSSFPTVIPTLRPTKAPTRLPSTTPSHVPSANNPYQLEWYLVNADSNLDYKPIDCSNQVFSFQSIGTKRLSVRVEVPSTAKTVNFEWPNTFFRSLWHGRRRDNDSPLYITTRWFGNVLPIAYLRTPGTKTISIQMFDPSGRRVGKETIIFELVP
jgi:hypothetical protein